MTRRSGGRGALDSPVRATDISSSTTGYALESESEFARLERQSRTAGYDYRVELSDIVTGREFGRGERILDAGCGSGIVARFLAESFSRAEVYGCDFSATRVAQAREASKAHSNLTIEQADLATLQYPDGRFDLIVCPYVLQHLNPRLRCQALSELFRCLKPGAILRIIETDGLFFNLSPMPKLLARRMDQWHRDDAVDMFVGRKLPRMMVEQGFVGVTWEIQAVNCRGELLDAEIQLNSERLEQAQPLFERVFGSRVAARRFAQEYLRAMRQPGAVVFHNKFLISASK